MSLFCFTPFACIKSSFANATRSFLNVTSYPPDVRTPTESRFFFKSDSFSNHEIHVSNRRVLSYSSHAFWELFTFPMHTFPIPRTLHSASSFFRVSTESESHSLQKVTWRDVPLSINQTLSASICNNCRTSSRGHWATVCSHKDIIFRRSM